MKVGNRKKNDRKRLWRKGKKCPECGESVENGYHYVPALGLWSCTGREQPMMTLADICGQNN